MTWMMTMENLKFISAGLIISILFSGLSAAQGMGNSRAYDQSLTEWMGTPAYSDNQFSTDASDYFTPFGSARPDTNYQSTASGSLALEPADPADLGLAVGNNERLANALYIQMAGQLLSQGSATLGEQYTIWARVNSRGSFQLYDYSSLILSQTLVTPGWYRINGTYANYLGQHLYQFISAGLVSNNVSVIVSQGSYPTSFSLTGQVLDNSGQGISGAKVIAANSDGGKFSTTTDESGYYAIDVATGTYLVSAEHPDYVFTTTSAQATAGLVSAARPLVGSSSTPVLPPAGLQ